MRPPHNASWDRARERRASAGVAATGGILQARTSDSGRGRLIAGVARYRRSGRLTQPANVRDLVAPGQLCKPVLHIYRIRPSGREGAYGREDHRLAGRRSAGTVPRHPWLLAAGTSSSPADAGKSVGTDRPIGGQQFLIGRCDGPLLTGGNPVGHRRQQFGGATRRLTLLAASRSSH